MFVDDILEMLEAGWEPKEIAKELKIPLEAVYEAPRFTYETLRGVMVVAEASSRREYTREAGDALKEERRRCCSSTKYKCKGYQ
ncbi:hypothetical protein Pyrfu_1232 [Pyrolobus fumarii 1A]|uniref:Uncharacterized protein n=1 Tax=Pyrolobus fumarii (strain DSM 11204 / 1A) TaxID=694429 RepID=G0EFZ0_PYRF1|nr:DUF433 domain-containing protein [Pyrolobus fumarii]AEM39091.1 hypothetical protein Pyrfu_1232 [Pyrolobus fumarii 1A]